MDDNEFKQSLKTLHWGTGMPIIAVTTAGMFQVRCRGSYSLEVKSMEKLESKLSEIEKTGSWVSSLIVTKVTDSINEVAPGLTSAQQLTTNIVEISKTVNDGVSKSIDEAGLVMTNFTIDAIDILA